MGVGNCLHWPLLLRGDEENIVAKYVPLRTMWLAHCFRMHLVGAKPLNRHLFGQKVLKMAIL